MELKYKIENIIKATVTNPSAEILSLDKEKCFRLLQENAKIFPNPVSLSAGNM